MLAEEIDRTVLDCDTAFHEAHGLAYRLCEFAWKMFPRAGPFVEIAPVSMSHGPFGDGLNAVIVRLSALRSALEHRYGEQERMCYFVENWPLE